MLEVELPVIKWCTCGRSRCKKVLAPIQAQRFVMRRQFWLSGSCAPACEHCLSVCAEFESSVFCALAHLAEVVDMASQRRSTRQAHERAANRKRPLRSQYIEPDTDDDLEAESEDEEEEAEPAPQRSRKRRRVARQPKPQTRSKTKVATKRKIINVGRPRKARKQHDPDAKNTVKQYTGPTDGRIPAWTSLPIDILLSVFEYASQPLYSLDNVRWLMGAALTCKAFAQPALEAYYRNPAIMTRLQPHHLLALLQMDKRFMDYNVKVRRLQIDVEHLAYTAYQKELFNLGALVSQLPRLEHLEITHPMDLPANFYKNMRKVQRWYYPADLFDKLEQRNIRLKTWRWSRDMIADAPLFPAIAAAHNRECLALVQHLTICGFDVHDSRPTIESGEDGAERQLDLPWAISKLSDLKDLTFISCNVIRDKFFDRLPVRLERLELSNCNEFNSSMLDAYLTTSGSELRELVLNHNAALDLQFLPNLKVNCPKLEVLKVDLLYYSDLSVTNDAEPLWDELLTDDDIPTWPPTLHSLELLHLRKWSATATENFMRSLADCAPDLPDLRSLIILAHINISYRDRVALRDKWVERLEHIFQRRPSDPNPHYGSHRQIKLWKQAQSKQKRDSLLDSHGELANGLTDGEPAVRRSISHVQISPYKHTGDTEVDTDASPVKRTARRSKRVAESQASQTATPAPESQESAPETEAEDDEEVFVQGLCDKVSVTIDNQRPMQQQYVEKDFLDSEVSGDEDWHEGADEEEDDRYAW